MVENFVSLSFKQIMVVFMRIAFLTSTHHNLYFEKLDKDFHLYVLYINLLPLKKITKSMKYLLIWRIMLMTVVHRKMVWFTKLFR